MGLVGVNPHQGVVNIVEQRAVAHLGRGLKLSVVEPFGRETHQRLVHAILHTQQPHHLRLAVCHLLHERAAQTTAHGLCTLHCGGQLLVVASQYHAVGLLQGYPAGGLECLCGFVDEQCVVVLSGKQLVGGTRKRAGYHAALVEQGMAYAHLQFVSTLAQTCYFLMEVLTPPLARQAVELTYAAAHLPQIGIVGVRFKTVFVGVGQHGFCHATGVANAQHRYAAVGQLLTNPVNRGVALCADHHLRFATQHLAHSLNQGGGLASTGRAMHYQHVLGTQHITHSRLL